MAIYTHPTLRQQTYEEALSKIESARARRVVTAIEHRAAVEKKHDGMNLKLSGQWEKSRDKAFVLINRAKENLEKAEKEIHKMQELSGHISLVERD